MSDTELKKASIIHGVTENLTPNENRIKGGEMSLFSLSQLNGVIYEEVKKELRAPLNKKIYKQMLNDSSIETPYNLIEMMVSKPKWKVIPKKDAPAVEKTRAKMLNYMISTTERPWSEYIVEGMSYLPYGFWLGEKIYKKITTPNGVFKGLKDIETISQDTVERWHFDDNTGANIGVRQDLSLIPHQGSGKKFTGYVDIPKLKYLHMRNSVKRNNPEGRSILNSIYICWKYKALLEEFLTIGAIKDLGGIPIFQVHSEVLAKAAEDPNGTEATLLEQLKNMGQGLHSGDLAFGIVPVDYDDKGNKLYDFKLQGIEGGGKQYDILEVIKHYSNQILMRFFADALSLGTDGSGSYALSDNKFNLIEFATEHHLEVFKRTFNHDLMRQIYKVNGWEYDPETSCEFVYDKLSDGDLTAIASAIQKILAVGGMRVTKDLEDYLYGLFDIEPPTEDSEFLETDNKSRVGDGMEEGLPNGVGESTAKGSDRATANVSKETV